MIAQEEPTVLPLKGESMLQKTTEMTAIVFSVYFMTLSKGVTIGQEKQTYID